MARELVSVCIQNEDLTDKLSYHEALQQKYAVSRHFPYFVCNLVQLEWFSDRRMSVSVGIPFSIVHFPGQEPQLEHKIKFNFRDSHTAFLTAIFCFPELVDGAADVSKETLR